tara:strand:+ start:101 stop:304 length:204 start_codon:yes stop_codon:yes gene_type:complete
MYDFSGTGKNGGLVYQFDFRIRQICFKATGQIEGFLKTAMITDITARLLILTVIIFARKETHFSGYY